MSETNKPRQFWIVTKFRNMEVSLEVHKQKPAWKEIQLGSERIHVIELAPMLKMMDAMAEALEFYKNHADCKTMNIRCLCKYCTNEENYRHMPTPYKTFKKENGLDK